MESEIRVNRVAPVARCLRGGGARVSTLRFRVKEEVVATGRRPVAASSPGSLSLVAAALRSLALMRLSERESERTEPLLVSNVLLYPDLMDGGNHLEILNFLFQSGDVVPVLQYLFDTAKQMMELDVSGFPSKYGTLPYHEDFSHYKSGLYKHITGGMMGGHAVKLIGWGTNDAGEDYWLLANQWNRGWGDDGYFKITRGNNE